MHDENMSAVNEEVTMPAADSDDWDDIDLSGLTDEDAAADEAGGENDDADTGEADQPAGEAEQETPAAEEPGEAEQEEPASDPGAGAESVPERFMLKHLGEEKDFSRDEVTTLAQKGLDYDRIRTERDSMRTEMPALREAMSFLKELAADSNTSVEQLIEDVRTRKLMARETNEGRTITETGAREQIRREKAARDKDNTPADRAEPVQESVPAEPEAAAQPARNVTADIRRFALTYPEVKATDIPQAVWDGYRAGKGDLVALYAITENAALRQKVAALEQNEKNRGRSAGSVKSAGTRSAKSTLQEVWDAYDD